jgi:hypothetical protein
MNGRLLHEAGYVSRPSGVWAKTVRFGPPLCCAETLVRSASGRLLRVERSKRAQALAVQRRTELRPSQKEQ